MGSAGSCDASYYASPFGADSTAATYLERGTWVRIFHGGRHVDLEVRDRGPCYHWDGMTCTRPVDDRCFDLDDDAFARLAPTSSGVIEVRWRILERTTRL